MWPGEVVVDSRQMNMLVVDHLAELALSDFALTTDPGNAKYEAEFLVSILKSLSAVFKYTEAWKQYRDGIKPDERFAKALRLTGVNGLKKLDGISFDTLEKEYKDHPDLFAQRHEAARLVVP